MADIYFRFIMVAAGSSTLAWLAMKYLIARHQGVCEVRSLDLLVAVVLASSTCGFVGIMLIDGTKYANSPFFYWLLPIAIGSVFGVIGCQQVFLSSKSEK